MLKDIKVMRDTICDTCRALHQKMHRGYPEKVYENALLHSLRKKGLSVQRECPIKVFYEQGTPLFEYPSYLCVEDIFIVEISMSRQISPEHIKQLFNRLRFCNIRDGLLVNFGSSRLEIKHCRVSPNEFVPFSCRDRRKRQ